MVKRNKNFAKLRAGYLFPEIGKRRREFQANNPEAKIISLGIGDTPGPLTPKITESLVASAKGMGTKEGYTGYLDDGLPKLRELINKRFYNGNFSDEEIFVSDGAKPDTGRLQAMFGSECSLAVQNPAYPVYVDSAVMTGQTGEFNDETSQFNGISYLSCTPENNFFPDFKNAEKTDLIYFCSPNNPTGAVATKEQLKELVDFAKANNSIIIFDAAYSAFIKDTSLPTSIFEIEGSKEVAIEVNSFSKLAGFTGVRLGWSVVPKELKFDDGTPVIKDWGRMMGTCFNGASNIVQMAGIGVLEDTGWQEAQNLVSSFLDNAQLIKVALEEKGLEVYAGENAPYVWAKIPGKTSWESFDHILNNAHVVCTPGSGFGSAGEGFVRFSAFGDRANIEEAIQRLKKVL